MTATPVLPRLGNQERIKEWTTALRDPERKQGKYTLEEINSEGTKFQCCLGVGCEIAGVEKAASRTQGLTSYSGQLALAPVELADWLEIPAPSVDADGGTRIRLDIPQKGEKDMYLDRDGRTFSWLPVLNDDGMTFVQIADLIDYFGVR